MKMKAPSSFETSETDYPVTRRHPKRMESKTLQWKHQVFHFILSFLPFSFVLAFIFFFASLSSSQSNLTICFLLYEPATPYFATLHERRGLIHGPLFDMAHSAVSWLWLDYVHSGNATSPGGLKLSWQPPLNDRATNWRLWVRGRGETGGSAGTDRGVTQTSPAGLQGFSTTRHADRQHHVFCKQLSTHTSRSGVNIIRETYSSLNLTKKKTKLRALSPHANYTDRAAAAGRRS